MVKFRSHKGYYTRGRTEETSTYVKGSGKKNSSRSKRKHMGRPRRARQSRGLRDFRRRFYQEQISQKGLQ